MIGLAVSRAEQKLAHSLRAPLAWEPMPLATYGGTLPNMICSSWVFILRAQTRTGAERHPNSHQRMMSYRGSGDLQIWTDESVPSNEGKGWCSNPLVSDPEARIESRWVSIPPNIWHQAVVPEENWVVVSFHTVAEGELMEERPDAADTELTHQRRYMEHYA
jgi:hypothetical protein